MPSFLGVTWNSMPVSNFEHHNFLTARTRDKSRTLIPANGAWLAITDASAVPVLVEEYRRWDGRVCLQVRIALRKPMGLD